MAQTTLNIYAADQIFKCVRQQLYCSVVLKPLILLATLPVYWVLSSVLQLVCWRGMRVSRGFVFTVGKSNNPFPGNGKGDGSPYGSAAAVGVCIIPLLFVRIFAPERFLAGNILCCVWHPLVAARSLILWVTDYIRSCSASQYIKPSMKTLIHIQVGYSWIDGHAVQFASPGAQFIVSRKSY
jgi:hypothetical protein